MVIAYAVPILPGKREAYEEFLAELRGPRREEYRASRRRLGVRERAFLQHDPNGGADLVIVTIEGPDLAAALAAFSGLRDPFTRWFLERVREIHGYDLQNPPRGVPPMLIMDSGD
jgi:hypothetical protein